MNPNLNSGKEDAPVANRLTPPNSVPWQPPVPKAKRTRDSQIWRAVVVGVFALIAVFACLEGLIPTPKKPEPAEAKLLRDHAPAIPAKPLPPSTVKKSPAPHLPAPADSIIPQPPPVAPAVEETIAAVPTEAELLAKEPDLLLIGSESLHDAAVTRDQELLNRTINGKAWDAYRALLGRSIKTGISKLAPAHGVNRFDPVWKEPVLYQAFLRWKTLGCFSESDISALVSDAYSGGALVWLLHNNKAMEELLLTILPADNAGKVLKFLLDARQLHEDKFEKYFSLALACAVVFDNPMSIPHPIGSKEYNAEASVDPMQRFQWYVAKNEKGKLAAPVHHSSALDLIWVVCAPVTTSELEWAVDKMHLRRKKWGDAYGMIKYLMEKAVEGFNPYEEYSFAEILKEGGICGDQSYFCVNTARAQGIPAMTIGGETDLGGHAWAGVKIDTDEWTTGVGRVGGASKGQAGNPQTGGSISEQEIQLWNDRFHQSPITTLSVWRHLWLADYFKAMSNTGDEASAIRLANQLGHTFTETWKALYSLLERQMQLVGEPPVPNNLEEWKSFAKDMRREYKDNPRMAELAANAEVEYIFPYGPEGDAKRTLLRERRRIERDAGEQKDLIASSLKREAGLIMKRGGPDAKRDIGRLYDRALRDYGGSITGFKMMAEDYFSYCKDDKESARKAARDIELAFKRVVETDTRDWFRANTESSIYKMICGYYRTAGDPDRAELLEKRYELLLRRVKRDAS